VHFGEYRTNQYGSVSGEFGLSDYAIPGSYLMTLALVGGRMILLTAEYRKPEFESP
jgi:hypothetical protein